MKSLWLDVLYPVAFFCMKNPEKKVPSSSLPPLSLSPSSPEKRNEVPSTPGLQGGRRERAKQSWEKLPFFSRLSEGRAGLWFCPSLPFPSLVFSPKDKMNLVKATSFNRIRPIVSNTRRSRKKWPLFGQKLGELVRANPSKSVVFVGAFF